MTWSASASTRTIGSASGAVRSASMLLEVAVVDGACDPEGRNHAQRQLLVPFPQALERSSALAVERVPTGQAQAVGAFDGFADAGSSSPGAGGRRGVEAGSALTVASPAFSPRRRQRRAGSVASASREPGKNRSAVRVDDRRGPAAEALDLPVAADAIDAIAANGDGFGKRRSRRRPCRRARCKSADRSGRCHRRAVRRRSGPATSVTPTIAATTTAVRRAAMGRGESYTRPPLNRLHFLVPCPPSWLSRGGCGAPRTAK